MMQVSISAGVLSRVLSVLAYKWGGGGGGAGGVFGKQTVLNRTKSSHANRLVLHNVEPEQNECDAVQNMWKSTSGAL